MEKICTMCNVSKPALDFNAKQSKCKTCQVEYNKQRRRGQRGSIASSSIQTEDHVRGWLADQVEEHFMERLTDIENKIILTDEYASKILDKLADIKNRAVRNEEHLVKIMKSIESQKSRSRIDNIVKIMSFTLIIPFIVCTLSG